MNRPTAVLCTIGMLVAIAAVVVSVVVWPVDAGFALLAIMVACLAALLYGVFRNMP